MSKHLLDDSFDAMAEVKRGAPRAYSFGLGKKSISSANNLDMGDPRFEEVNASYDPEELEERDLLDSKRAQEASHLTRGHGSKSKLRSLATSQGLMAKPNMYSFGLGKRGWLTQLSIPTPDYYGDIKRRYSFGLGKRSVPSNTNAYFESFQE